MFRVGRVVGYVTERAICDFGYASLDEVIQVERECTIRNGLVAMRDGQWVEIKRTTAEATHT